MGSVLLPAGIVVLGVASGVWIMRRILAEVTSTVHADQHLFDRRPVRRRPAPDGGGHADLRAPDPAVTLE